MTLRTIHWYLGLSVKFFMASMLLPDEFGRHLVSGKSKSRRGKPLIFVEVNPDNGLVNFPPEKIAEMIRSCVPHEDGSKKKTVWGEVYRTLERVPISSIEALYITAPNGATLRLKDSDSASSVDHPYSLFQDLTPIRNVVVARSSLRDYIKFMAPAAGHRGSFFTVPCLAALEYDLGGWGMDPSGPIPANLPFADMDHLRECLLEIAAGGKVMKSFDLSPETIYLRRIVRICIGSEEQGIKEFSLPTMAELEIHNHGYWRCVKGQIFNS